MSSPHSRSHAAIRGMSAISPTPQLLVDGIEKSGTSRPAWRASQRDGIAVLALKDLAGPSRTSLCPASTALRDRRQQFRRPAPAIGLAAAAQQRALCVFPHIAGGSSTGHYRNRCQHEAPTSRDHSVAAQRRCRDGRRRPSPRGRLTIAGRHRRDAGDGRTRTSPALALPIRLATIRRRLAALHATRRYRAGRSTSTPRLVDPDGTDPKRPSLSRSAGPNGAPPTLVSRRWRRLPRSDSTTSTSTC